MGTVPPRLARPPRHWEHYAIDDLHVVEGLRASGYSCEQVHDNWWAINLHLEHGETLTLASGTNILRLGARLIVCANALPKHDPESVRSDLSQEFAVYDNQELQLVPYDQL